MSTTENMEKTDVTHSLQGLSREGLRGFWSICLTAGAKDECGHRSTPIGNCVFTNENNITASEFPVPTMARWSGVRNLRRIIDDCIVSQLKRYREFGASHDR